MGDIHKAKWFWQLPWTMLGRRVAYSPDLGASPTQLTLGSCPVIPGGLVNDPGPPLARNEASHLLETLQTQAARPPVQTSNHSSNSAVNVNDLKAKKASHVYVRVDNPKSLMPKYCGPFEVISRPSDSTVKIKTGNYVSGRPMVELHTWSRCKPAFIRDGAPLAERARRGRPRLEPTSTHTPTSTSGDVLTPELDAPSEISSEPKQNETRENSNRPTRTRRQPDRLGIDPALN